MNNNKISIARIIKSHGLKGAVKVAVADERDGRFKKGQHLYTEDGEALTVLNFSDNGLVSILEFEEVDSIDGAERLKNKDLLIDEQDLAPREDGSYYIKDLLGSRVTDTEGLELGQVKDVLNYSANDVLVIDYKGKDCLVPFIEQIIVSVDTDKGLIIMDPIEGLFDED